MSVRPTTGVQFDLDLRNFIEKERQASRFNLLVHDLNDKCWDLCMHNIRAHLEPKTESCLVNCVERFLDTTNYILNRLERTQALIRNTNPMNFE